MRRTVIGVAAVTGIAAALSGVNLATAASGGSGGSARIGVYGSGLNGPFGVDTVGKKSFVVAESAAGKVTLIGKKGGEAPWSPDAPGVAGVAFRKGKVYSVLGGPSDAGTPPPGTYKPSAVLRTNLQDGQDQGHRQPAQLRAEPQP